MGNCRGGDTPAVFASHRADARGLASAGEAGDILPTPSKVIREKGTREEPEAPYLRTPPSKIRENSGHSGTTGTQDPPGASAQVASRIPLREK